MTLPSAPVSTIARGPELEADVSRNAVLDRHRELSHPGAEEGLSCSCPSRSRIYLRADDGELVYSRGGCSNLCDYCARLALTESAEMLSLDALEGDAPAVLMVLTTRTATLEREPFYKAREKLFRALRRRWPELQYTSLLEYTTGYADTSGGERRPHWNYLLKGVSKADIPAIKAIVDERWCSNIDAEPAAQCVRDLYAVGGVIRYLTQHFGKESQRPPPGFHGQRFNCSRGYFGVSTRAQARARARESLALKRELWRARRAGLRGARAEARAQSDYRYSVARVWIPCDAHGVPCFGLIYNPHAFPLSRRRSAPKIHLPKRRGSFVAVAPTQISDSRRALGA
jgi:hypothetical protein